MTEESFDCSATASLLDCGAVAANASNAAAIAAAVATALTGNWATGMSLLVWPVVCWFAARVALDASLFRAMAGEPAARSEMLDRYLVRSGLGNPPAGRSLEDRQWGALRLLRSLIVAFALQAVTLIGGVVMIGWNRHA